MSARQRAFLALLFSATAVSFLSGVLLVWTRGWLSDAMNAGHPRISVLAIVGSALALAVTIHAFVGRDPVIPIVLLGWAPSILVAAQIHMWSPIVHGPDEIPCGIAVIPALLSPLMAALLAPRLRVPGAFPIVLSAIVALFVGLGFARLRTHPDPDEALDRLPVRSTLEVGGQTELGGLVVKMPPGTDWRACWLEDVRVPHHLTSHTLTCGKQSILRDDANDLWIIRPTTGPGDAALRGTPPAQIDPIYPMTIHKTLAPPVGWVHGAAGGLVLTLIVLLTTKKRLEAFAVLTLSAGPLLVAAANRLVF